jgi:[ribosomal protein S5]-alanine N-acetyltransferase
VEKMRLESERLILRVPRENEAESLVASINNPNVVRYLSKVPFPYGIKDAKGFIKKSREKARKKKKEDFAFSIQLKSEKGIVGGIGLHEYEEYPGIAEIGYWIAEEHWKKGLMSEAVEKILQYGFQEVGLRRIVLKAAEVNGGSNAIAKKFGFSLEGKLRQGMKSRVDKQIYDVNVYGLLKSEWESRRS